MFPDYPGFVNLLARISNPQSRIPALQMPAKSFKRSDRVSAELRREIALLVHAAVREHALPSVSVSDVEVTRDLDMATIYVTALIGDQSKEAVAGLNELAKEFRHVLSQSMKLRRVPELRFRYDDSVDKGERIESLLREGRASGSGNGE
jgi:ribosome-binding factor A